MKLHIGGEETKEGWTIFNIQKKKHVDIVGSLEDLSQFSENSIEQIYASHVFEHVKIANCLKILKDIHKKIPILGVCLGHQIIGQVFGGKIVRAKNLMHGKISKIKHHKKGLLRNIQNNFDATRYHSLTIDRKTFPNDLIITAETKNKTIMGLMHKDYNIHGFQFHPESISTKMGVKLIKNFITN